MTESKSQIRFNDAVITAIMTSDISEAHKILKLQNFVNRADSLYDKLCDLIYCLLVNKETNHDKNIVYISFDGKPFVGDSSVNTADAHPVLMINRYSPACSDLAVYVDVAISHFLECIALAKTENGSYCG